jgi:Holliday junction resolvase RusA-like endonuclease
MRWIGQANMAFLAQKRELGKPIIGPFSIEIILDDKKRGVRDLDNYVKSVLDHCQRLGLIENDKLAEEISVRWGRPDGGGCLVQIFPATAEARAA